MNAMRSFVEISHSQNGENSLSLTDLGKSCSSGNFFIVTYMYVNTIRKHKILANFFEFTVFIGPIKQIIIINITL